MKAQGTRVVSSPPQCGRGRGGKRRGDAHARAAHDLLRAVPGLVHTRLCVNTRLRKQADSRVPAFPGLADVVSQ